MVNIYHGSSEKHLPSLLKDGIVPRERTGEGNWTKFLSSPTMNYLSTAYPFYFAYNAIDSETDERMLVLEIDEDKLDHELKYPDEDFIAQVLVDHYTGMSLEAAQDLALENIESYQMCWEDSLSNLGTMAYKGIIPPTAFTRYVLVDWKKQALSVMKALDPAIMIINFKFMGEFYKKLVAWFFGDLEKFPLEPHISTMELSHKETYDKIIEQWKEMATNRDGIEVTNLREVTFST